MHGTMARMRQTSCPDGARLMSSDPGLEAVAQPPTCCRCAMLHSKRHPCIADGHAHPDCSMAEGCTAVVGIAPDAQETVVFEGNALVSQQCPATRRRASSCFTTIPHLSTRIYLATDEGVQVHALSCVPAPPCPL